MYFRNCLLCSKSPLKIQPASLSNDSYRVRNSTGILRRYGLNVRNGAIYILGKDSTLWPIVRCRLDLFIVVWYLAGMHGQVAFPRLIGAAKAFQQFLPGSLSVALHHQVVPSRHRVP